MSDDMILRVFDVEHGACAMLLSPTGRRLAMIDCGHNVTTRWRPSTYLRQRLNRTSIDYLFITNADQDHMSDLDGLWNFGIEVAALYRNRSPDADCLRRIKEQQGELTDDIKRFIAIHADYTAPLPLPFDAGMDGVTCSTFGNSYPAFTDTNNLSLAIFIKYAGFKILFPGDLEEAGWKKLLENSSFVQELTNTDILIASHHGRWGGFCDDIFDYFTPQAVVISDKPMTYETQETVPDYRAVVHPNGVVVSNQNKRRHVLTTRRDGDIIFKVSTTGFTITTANGAEWPLRLNP
jgi:beta-lactamase superfamily II metal-dependent hydrolase